MAAVGGSVYRVTIDDGGIRTTHDVRLTPEHIAKYAPGAGPGRLVRVAVEFLLEQEEREQIEPRFELPAIEQRHAGFVRAIQQRLGTGGAP